MLPKALHANMFMVRHAREVMDPNVLVLPAEASFDSVLRERQIRGRFQHVVVTQRGRLYGVIRINTGLWRGIESTNLPMTVGQVASRDYTVVREDAIAFDVIERMWRKRAFMAIVVKGSGIPRGEDVVGVITKEHVADSVASGMKIYPG